MNTAEQSLLIREAILSRLADVQEAGLTLDSLKRGCSTLGFVISEDLLDEHLAYLIHSSLARVKSSPLCEEFQTFHITKAGMELVTPTETTATAEIAAKTKRNIPWKKLSPFGVVLAWILETFFTR